MPRNLTKRQKQAKAREKREQEWQDYDLDSEHGSAGNPSQEDATTQKLDQLLAGMASMQTRLVALETPATAAITQATRGSPARSSAAADSTMPGGDPEVHFRTPEHCTSASASHTQHLTAEAIAHRLREFDQG